jgi:hypothetical protein
VRGWSQMQTLALPIDPSWAVGSGAVGSGGVGSGAIGIGGVGSGAVGIGGVGSGASHVSRKRAAEGAAQGGEVSEVSEVSEVQGGRALGPGGNKRAVIAPEHVVVLKAAGQQQPKA